MTLDGIENRLKNRGRCEGTPGSVVAGYYILRLVIRKERMRKHKKKLYKQIHGILFAKAVDDLCRSIYDRLVDEYFQDWEYA